MFAKIRALIAALWEFLIFCYRFTFLAEKAVEKIEAQTAPITEERRCDNCAHWDWEEGQAALAQAPEFWHRVAPHISPQRMMERYDAKGELIPADVTLRAKENGWQHFGACTVKDQCTHRSYNCELWTLRKKPTTVVS